MISVAPRSFGIVALVTVVASIACSTTAPAVTPSCATVCLGAADCGGVSCIEYCAFEEAACEGAGTPTVFTDWLACNATLACANGAYLGLSTCVDQNAALTTCRVTTTAPDGGSRKPDASSTKPDASSTKPDAHSLPFTDAAQDVTTNPSCPTATAASLASNPHDDDAIPPFVTYMDNLATHPGCSTAGLSTRRAVDGSDAGYTAAVINGGAYTCAAKEYGTDDGKKPIVVLVHGNSSTPLDWEAYAGDTAHTPMIAETLVADGYHLYAADVRYDLVPTDTQNNPAKNFDHDWAVPIVESLLTNLFAQYPAPRMFNLAGFSTGSTVLRDALRRMLRNGENPFARVHSVLYASGANHGSSSYATECVNENAPMNTTMAGLVACQVGNRTNYTVTPFELPLNGGATDLASFETPCADGNTAYGQTGACGCNAVQYTTSVYADGPGGTLLDEFVSEASAMLDGATNMTVTQPEPGMCTGTGASAVCTGYFFYPNYEYHYGSIRSAQGIALAKSSLEAE